MALLSLLFTFLLTLYSLTHAHPTNIKERGTCNLPSSQYYSCSNNVVTIHTGSYGDVQGTLTSGGAIRVNAKYATAARWTNPTVNTFANAFATSTGLPPSCPQVEVAAANYSEDCLYSLVYFPTTITPQQWATAPVIFWIHGGSFVRGSATDPAIEGSKLAQATNSIVVVVQYRLGVLGYLPPSGTGSSGANYGVKDIIAALQFIKNTFNLFGVGGGPVTLTGQSSGGSMIRYILASPSASSLYSRAILESDPINYGILQPSTFTNYQSAYYTNYTTCGSSCSTTPVAQLLTAQNSFLSAAPTIDPAGGFGEPLRPYKDGSLVQYTLTTSFPPYLQQKNLLLTSAANDAGVAVYSSVPQLPSTYWDYIVSQLFGQSRVAPIDTTYAVQVATMDPNDIRPELVDVSTDGAWRCSAYALANAWAQRGGSVWVGEFTLGATYPGNEQYSYCTTGGHVCHEDDIEIVFGTVSSPTSAQAALVTQVQARWGAFAKYGNPNTNGQQNWAQVGWGSLPVYNLGGTSTIPYGACSAWGSSIPFDYQIYGQ